MYYNHIVFGRSVGRRRCWQRPAFVVSGRHRKRTLDGVNVDAYVRELFVSAVVLGLVAASNHTSMPLSIYLYA